MLTERAKVVHFGWQTGDEIAFYLGACGWEKVAALRHVFYKKLADGAWQVSCDTGSFPRVAVSIYSKAKGLEGSCVFDLTVPGVPEALAQELSAWEHIERGSGEAVN